VQPDSAKDGSPPEPWIERSRQLPEIAQPIAWLVPGPLSKAFVVLALTRLSN
jgi:hypothetical protein